MPDRGWLTKSRVVVMAKEPRAGYVKTRLARDIGTSQAARVFRNTLASVTYRLARDRRWRTELAVAPRASLGSRLLPTKVARSLQAPGGLGQRLKAVSVSPGAGPILIIGSDIPGVDAAMVARALALLRASDAVLGPALDGGYWAVGLKSPKRLGGAFLKVRWSSPHALADTLAALLRAGAVKIAFADVLGDVDTAQDLAALQGCLGRRVLSGNTSADLRLCE